MKNKKLLLVVLALLVFCITGCFTLKQPVAARCSFAGNESEKNTAMITFVQESRVGVRLYDCEDVPVPEPPVGAKWEPEIIFPAGKSLNLRVFVYWNEDRYGERRRGIFRCPPLEAGKEYKLWFVGDLRGGSLILTYSNVSYLRYLAGKPQFEIVYEQVIPPVPK